MPNFFSDEFIGYTYVIWAKKRHFIFTEKAYELTSSTFRLNFERVSHYLRRCSNWDLYFHRVFILFCSRKKEIIDIPSSRFLYNKDTLINNRRCAIISMKNQLAIIPLLLTAYDSLRSVSEKCNITSTFQLLSEMFQTRWNVRLCLSYILMLTVTFQWCYGDTLSICATKSTTTDQK